jgi:hypothetical protein
MDGFLYKKPIRDSIGDTMETHITPRGNTMFQNVNSKPLSAAQSTRQKIIPIGSKQILQKVCLSSALFIPGFLCRKHEKTFA